MARALTKRGGEGRRSRVPTGVQPENTRIRVAVASLCIYTRHWIVSAAVGGPVTAPGNDWGRQICSVHHALLPRFQNLWASCCPEKPSLRMVPAILNLCASIICTLPPSTQTNRANKSTRRQKRHQIYPHRLIPLLIRHPDWPGEHKQNTQELKHSTAHHEINFSEFNGF